MLSQARKNSLNELFEKLNIKTNDFLLFDEALTHPSYNFELNLNNAPDYERLEFLGDSVLRLVMSNLLYDKYSDYNEGKLTKIRSCLVSDSFLHTLAEKINLKTYIKLGEHEEKDGGREKESISACAMEALFGAVYLSNGYQCAKQLISHIYSIIDINVEDILIFYNSKEVLQQYTQGKNKDLPEYRIVKEYGKAHDRTYEVEVIYHSEILGYGIGKTKKDAEKNAAAEAVKKLKILKELPNE